MIVRRIETVLVLLAFCCGLFVTPHLAAAQDSEDPLAEPIVILPEEIHVDTVLTDTASSQPPPPGELPPWVIRAAIDRVIETQPGTKQLDAIQQEYGVSPDEAQRLLRRTLLYYSSPEFREWVQTMDRRLEMATTAAEVTELGAKIVGILLTPPAVAAQGVAAVTVGLVAWAGLVYDMQGRMLEMEGKATGDPRKEQWGKDLREGGKLLDTVATFGTWGLKMTPAQRQAAAKHPEMLYLDVIKEGDFRKHFWEGVTGPPAARGSGGVDRASSGSSEPNAASCDDRLSTFLNSGMTEGDQDFLAETMNGCEERRGSLYAICACSLVSSGRSSYSCKGGFRAGNVASGIESLKESRAANCEKDPDNEGYCAPLSVIVQSYERIGAQPAAPFPCVE